MSYLINRYKDYLGGALMFLLGAWAALQGLGYQVGTLSHMGPGFFPTAVGAILALSGLAIAFTGKPDPQAEEKALPPEWRGWCCIILSVIAFIVIGQYGGLLPATFAIVFISALGDRHNSVKAALLLAAGVCVICLVVFWWALKVQFPLFRWG